MNTIPSFVTVDDPSEWACQECPETGSSLWGLIIHLDHHHLGWRKNTTHSCGNCDGVAPESCLFNSDGVTIPAGHVDTVAAALRAHLDQYTPAKGIGESTTAGFIIRAIADLDQYAAATGPAPFAVEIRQLIETHGLDAVTAEIARQRATPSE